MLQLLEPLIGTGVFVLFINGITRSGTLQSVTADAVSITPYEAPHKTLVIPTCAIAFVQYTTEP